MEEILLQLRVSFGIRSLALQHNAWDDFGLININCNGLQTPVCLYSVLEPMASVILAFHYFELYNFKSSTKYRLPAKVETAGPYLRGRVISRQAAKTLHSAGSRS